MGGLIRPGVVLVLTGLPARAGMTSYTLNDVVRLRLEDISFFTVLLLVCSFGILVAWNYVARGVPFVPRLNFLRALCVTGVLSLLMLLVLSMISGARELLTPGVWRRQGTSYRLNENVSEPVRRQSLEYLKSALVDYRRGHDGRWPAHPLVPEIPEKIWLTPDSQGARYLYFPPLGAAGRTELVACEPESFGEQRYVLLSNGDVARWSTTEIRNALGVQR